MYSKHCWGILVERGIAQRRNPDVRTAAIVPFPSTESPDEAHSCGGEGMGFEVVPSGDFLTEIGEYKPLRFTAILTPLPSIFLTGIFFVNSPNDAPTALKLIFAHLYTRARTEENRSFDPLCSFAFSLFILFSQK